MIDLEAKVIYADPPWNWKARSAKGEGRSAKNHYDTMTLEQIKNMRPFIDAYRAEDCVLLLWATDPMLEEALDVMLAWGFIYKTVGFTWVKTNRDGSPFTGMGYWTRANPEMCLLGTRGRPQRLAKDVPQLIMAPRGAHSAKPPEVRKRIERLLPGPYLELFARETADGWYSWGNEI